jgi:hypothetical protein
MSDTLKPAKELGEGDILTGEQAERLAGVCDALTDFRPAGRDISTVLGVLGGVASIIRLLLTAR